jgi:hypothetical protein
MDDVGPVTGADVELMQGLAQRVTAARPDLVNSDASFGELAWIWGKGHASDGKSWLRRLWFAGDDLVACRPETLGGARLCDRSGLTW